MDELLDEQTHHAVEELKQFNLSGYEAEAYIVLLQLGEAQAREIAEASRVPQSRVYDVLGSLEQKGMVTKRTSSPKSYTPNEPQRVLEHLVYRIEKEHEERISSLRGQMEELVQMLPDRSAVTGEESSIRLVEGTYAVACRLIEEMQNVESTMAIVGDSPFVRLKSRTAFDNQIGNRNVEICALGVFDPDTIEEMERHKTLIHEREDILQTFFLFDNERLLQVSTMADRTPRGLITDEPGLVNTYADRFDQLWTGDTDFGDNQLPDGD